ncbi:hypothetical protein [Neptunicella sp. SCSIO 80796]|uniref:hypothetical protein n=1 Tax=Neptunicella plasticusilytica TaxID=3117012 RepID=UPI003A4E00F2
MKPITATIKTLAPLCLFALVACGGGGGSLSTSNNHNSGSPVTPTAPPPTEPDSLLLVSTETALQHQSVGLAALMPENLNGSAVHWQQLTGPQVTLLAADSQVISFDAEQTGNYSFEFTANTTDGSVSDTISLSVQSNSAAVVQIRLDHVAVEQGKVSLRVDSNSAFTSTQWQQISGPTVTLDKQGNMLFFDAPKVEFDTLLEFQATLKLANGSTTTDTVYVLIKNAEIAEDGYFPYYAEQVVTLSAHPYLPTSPYADVLVDCVYSNTLTDTCSFNQLPLIGMQHPQPQIEDIMQRVVVSHDWMGERFRQYLQQSDVSPDMLNLLRATTAIVISYDVRPSFYWSATGAIYLDADNFWLTPQERDTLNDAPDYRAEFGNQLQFSIPWTYTHNGSPAFVGYDPADRQPRAFADMEAEVTWLLYHELAHANDYIAPSRWSLLSANSNPLQEANRENIPSISKQMVIQYPWIDENSPLFGLADVSFDGDTPTSQQKAYQPDDILGLFRDDYATDFYNYSSQAEDLAMYFQHLMLSYRLGFTPVVAIIDNDDIVAWGEFNRISTSQLQGKGAFVIDNILPEVDSRDVYQSLQPLKNMQTGVSFSQSVRAGKQAKGLEQRLDRQIWLKHQRQASHIGRPKLPKARN